MLLCIERWYSTLRLLSLDVAMIALAGGILATRIVGSHPHASFYYLLPTGVWVAYTIDHLLDARRMGPTARTPRHRFHHQHAQILWLIVLALSFACAIVGWITLSTFGLLYTGIMCALVLLHETFIKLAGNLASLWLTKELGVAIIFTAGVWGMPLLRHRLDTGDLLGWPALLLLQYFLLALVNLIEFSIYEMKIDTADNQTSFVRALGRPGAFRLTQLLLAIQLPAATAAILLRPLAPIYAAECIYLLMTCGLLLLLIAPNFFARQERYRTLGDGVFLLPMLMILFS